MTQRYDLCTGRKDRDGKTHWTKIGVMFPSQQGDGFSIKLEAYPLPNDKGEVWVSAFVPKDRDDRGPPPRQSQAPARGHAPIDDDIPF
jgi:hypothetical protein